MLARQITRWLFRHHGCVKRHTFFLRSWIRTRRTFNAPEFDCRPKVATIATSEDHLVSTVGVKELKNCLTQYLRRTKQGEEVIVTERGNPICADSADQERGERCQLGGEAGQTCGTRSFGVADPKASEASPISKGLWQTHFESHCARALVIYLDTSALIKRFVNEKGSLLVRSLVAARESCGNCENRLRENLCRSHTQTP